MSTSAPINPNKGRFRSGGELVRVPFSEACETTRASAVSSAVGVDALGWPKLLCTSANVVRVGGTLGGCDGSPKGFCASRGKAKRGEVRTIGGDVWIEAGPDLTAVSWNLGPQRKVGLPFFRN